MQYRTRLRWTCEQIHMYLQVSSLVPASKFIRTREPIHPHLQVNSYVLASILTRTRESIHLHLRVILSEVMN